MKTYHAPDWQSYKMDWTGDPHPEMEPVEREIKEVDKALEALASWGILTDTAYSLEKFAAHRKAVRRFFDIPWTGISPRMERFLYAVNAVSQPIVMVAMGVFCGFTFICNAGAAVGPGACYAAEKLVGIERISREAERARRNVEKIDPEERAEIVSMDGEEWLARFDGTVDLLYIDADGSYLPIIREAARGKLSSGSLVLAHNSANLQFAIADYLRFVRDPENSRESVNVLIDDQGLEVTLRW